MEKHCTALSIGVLGRGWNLLGYHNGKLCHGPSHCPHSLPVGVYLHTLSPTVIDAVYQDSKHSASPLLNEDHYWFGNIPHLNPKLCQILVVGPEPHLPLGKSAKWTRFWDCPPKLSLCPMKGSKRLHTHHPGGQGRSHGPNPWSHQETKGTWGCLSCWVVNTEKVRNLW